MSKALFYVCSHCHNMVSYIDNRGPKLSCCNKEMDLVKENTTEASLEKHIPVFHIDNQILTVQVGSVSHPMIEAHYINWIMIVTNLGKQRKILRPLDLPEAKFALLPNEVVLEIYEYCNLHGLWKKVVHN